MPSPRTIRLFEAEPDLIRFLSAEQRAEAVTLELPVGTIAKGSVNVREIFARTGSFGAVVLDGMLLQSMRLGEHNGLRLLGPSDLLSLTDTPRSALVLDTDCRATVPTRLALLDRELLIAARRWPRLIAGLHARGGEQSERLLTQLMICQLPRVDDRLLTLLWLLAESWGQVTSSGTRLPVALTHEALGGLIGARRPTVTLAIGELVESGAIIRQQSGWLLLRRPPATKPQRLLRVEDPRPLKPGGSEWAADPPSQPDYEPIRKALRETVSRLREEHLRTADQLRDRFRRVASTRDQVAERRRRTAALTVRPRRAPSS